MTSAVIVDAVRSPMGKGKASGALAALHPADLLGQVLRTLVERNDLDPGSVDDVLVGCVGQAGEQSATPGRQAWLSAGFPTHVPSVTIERKCGSGQQAVDFAVLGRAGRRLRHRHRRRRGVDEPGADGFRPDGSRSRTGRRVRARFPDLVPQGVSAELVAGEVGPPP